MDILAHAEIMRKLGTGEYKDTSLTEALITLSDDYAAQMAALENITAANNQLVIENAEFRRQNTELFQRVGEQIKTSEPEPETKSTVTIDDIINEKGEWV